MIGFFSKRKTQVASKRAKLTTARLDLIAGTAKCFRVDVNDRVKLGQQLQALVPEAWPPEHLDQPAIDFAAEYLTNNPDSVGWMLWFMVLRANRKRVVIGSCGFKGKPSADGTVEIGYSVLNAYQRRGYATEAVNALLAWVFARPEVNRVVAETYPELVSSIRVLEKSGFRFIGAGSEERVIRFELPRERFEAANSLVVSNLGCPPHARLILKA